MCPGLAWRNQVGVNYSMLAILMKDIPELRENNSRNQDFIK